MRIDHINTLSRGGAAAAAHRIHASVAQAGLASRFWFVSGAALEDGLQVPQAPRPQSWWSALRRKWERAGRRRLLRRSLRGRPAGLELFSPTFAESPADVQWQALDGDLLHMHWVGGGLDLAGLLAAVAGKPIVWTLHDMQPMTGGCHYPHTCTYYLQGCGNCPQLAQPAAEDLSRRSYRAKSRLLEGVLERLTVVAPSRWLVREARNSPLLAGAARIHYIPYGLDLEAFAPCDPRAARKRLGLPLDRPILLLGADEVTNERKGLPHARRAWRALQDQRPRPLLAYFGSGTLEPDAWGGALKPLGYLRDRAHMIDAYRAADLFAMPSRYDNLPQTGMEALACGTPVVAFRVGGVPDFVRHGVSGLLASPRDDGDLARQIGRLLADAALRARLAESGRELIMEEFSLQRQANRYRELYEKLLAAA